VYDNVKILMIQMEVRIQLAGEQTGAAGRVAEDTQDGANKGLLRLHAFVFEKLGDIERHQSPIGNSAHNQLFPIRGPGRII
jgi:hypothetical protein